jgi:hypothetical protein
VVEWAEDGFVVLWEGTSRTFARRRAERYLLDALAECGEGCAEANARPH